jgi:replicative DNA helicase
MRLSAPIHRLKRAAREQARAEAVSLHAALDRIAASEGYSSWSLLAAKHTDASTNPGGLARSLAPGELILIAARPLQGKTMFALRLALSAIAQGREAHFFSLDYTERDVAARLATMPANLAQEASRLQLDCSDSISAGHIIGRLDAASRGAFIVVDYLQLLDQKRANPPLQEQVEALDAFARRGDHTIAFVCQIDRNFDADTGAQPGPDDIRLPNPLDLSVFSRAVFLHGDRCSVVNL